MTRYPVRLWHKLVDLWDGLAAFSDGARPWARRKRGKGARRRPVQPDFERLEKRSLMAAAAFSASSYFAFESGGSVMISVSLNQAPGQTVTVDYATSNGTATAGSDYTSTSGTLTWLTTDPLTKTFNVSITGDSLDEDGETINLALSNATGGLTLGTPNTATINISDDDPAPNLQFSSASFSAAEGNSGSSDAVITVTLSAASGRTVTVDYATSNGTATAGSDYTSASGTLTFDPGQTSKTFNVSITGDTTDEPDETVSLSLSNYVNAGVGSPSSATLTILDDEPTVSFSAGTASVGENAGKVTLTVSLSAAASSNVEVAYASANGTATAGTDYGAVSGTLLFTPGQTSKTIDVWVTDDAASEGGETFTVTLTDPAGPPWARTARPR